MIEGIRPDVLNPPAIIVQAFDEARALEEIKAAIERRNEAKGEYKGAVLVIGQKLIEARRAMPDQSLVGRVGSGASKKYSPGFEAFIEKCGLSRQAAATYMGYARKPERLFRKIEQTARRAQGRDTYKETQARYRRNTLQHVREMLLEAADLDAAIEAVDLELRELTA